MVMTVTMAASMLLRQRLQEQQCGPYYGRVTSREELDEMRDAKAGLLEGIVELKEKIIECKDKTITILMTEGRRLEAEVKSLKEERQQLKQKLKADQQQQQKITSLKAYTTKYYFWAATEVVSR
jgi:gas vesicle protein